MIQENPLQTAMETEYSLEEIPQWYYISPKEFQQMLLLMIHSSLAQSCHQL